MRRRVHVGRLKITFGTGFKEKDAWGKLWNRFGGGWRYELGIQIGGNSVILNLWMTSVRFDWTKKKAAS